MSKVESNDDIRIREMQEQQRLAETRQKDADTVKRNTEAFKAAMRGKASQTQDTRRTDGSKTRDAQRETAKQVLARVRREGPQKPHEKARQAAIRAAIHGAPGQLARRAKESHGESRVLSERADEYASAGLDDDRRVDDRLRDEDVREATGREEGVEEVRREHHELQMADDLMQERQGQQRRQQQQRERDEQRRETAAEATGGAREAQGSAGPTKSLPPEVLKRIAQTITKVVDDGRTRIRVRLKGQGLEGVELEIKAEDGKISCAFSGCNDQLRRDLEQAESALGSALAQRGLELRALEVR